MELKAAICFHIWIKNEMTMQRIIIIFTVLFLSASLAAQPGRRDIRTGAPMQDKKEAIEARRVSYITQKLDLTPDEAQAFWPIYNAYNREIEALSERIREQRAELPPVSELSAEQAAEYVEEEVYRFERAAELRREYTEKMLEVISVEKVAMLFEAERSFNRMLFREAQRRHRMDGRRGTD